MNMRVVDGEGGDKLAVNPQIIDCIVLEDREGYVCFTAVWVG